MTSPSGTPSARDNVLTVPSVGRRRPVSKSRSVLGSMSDAWANCARVQPRRIRSRSTTSERTCQPRAPTNRGSRLTAKPAGRRALKAGSFSVDEDARSFIPLVTVEGRVDRTHRRNAMTAPTHQDAGNLHTPVWCHCVYGVRREPRELIGAGTPQRGVPRRAGGAQTRGPRAGRGHTGGRPTRRDAGPAFGRLTAPGADPARPSHVAIRSPCWPLPRAALEERRGPFPSLLARA